MVTVASSTRPRAVREWPKPGRKRLLKGFVQLGFEFTFSMEKINWIFTFGS